jgi:hypothetical protein
MRWFRAAPFLIAYTRGFLQLRGAAQNALISPTGIFHRSSPGSSVRLPTFRHAILIFGLFTIACSDNPPGPGGGIIQLKLLDASATEVWLEIGVASGASVEVLRDGAPIDTIRTQKSNTVFVDAPLKLTYQDGAAFSTRCLQ